VFIYFHYFIYFVGLGNLGFGSGSFQEMQQNMQQELMSNPDTLRQMMDNPLVQSLMSNPDYMRQILTSNPQMQNLLEVCFGIDTFIENIVFTGSFT